VHLVFVYLFKQSSINQSLLRQKAAQITVNNDVKDIESLEL